MRLISERHRQTSFSPDGVTSLTVVLPVEIGDGAGELLPAYAAALLAADPGGFMLEPDPEEGGDPSDDQTQDDHGQRTQDAPRTRKRGAA